MQLTLGETGLILRPPTVAQTLLCALGAFVIAIADRAAVYASIGPLDAALWLRAVKLFAVLLLFCLIGELLVTRGLLHTNDSVGLNSRDPDGSSTSRSLSHRAPSWWARRSAGFRGCCLTICLAGAMLLCWSPYIKWLYPGLMWYDTGDEIAQFYGIAALGQPAGVISAHHPVFDTIVFGGFAKAGELWFGDYQAGLTVLVLLQMVAMCIALSASVVYARHVGAPFGSVITLFVFYAFFPFLPIFFMSLVKDSLHAVFFVPWLLMYIETCRQRLRSLRSIWFTVGFVALSVLSALTTMTGFYITALSLLGLVFVGRETENGGTSSQRKPVAMTVLRGVAATVAVVVILLVHTVFPAVTGKIWNIHHEDQNQILVVPMQMTARYVLDHPGDVTDEERHIIDTLNNVPVEQMKEVQNPYLADPVMHLSLKDPSYIGQYVSVWLKQGVRHPDSYINAFVSLESGWFSLQRTAHKETGPLPLDVLRADSRSIPNQVLIQGDNAISPSFAQMPQYRGNESGQATVRRIWQSVSSTRVLRLLTYTAVWSFILPLFLLFCAIRGRGRDIGERLMIGAPLIWSLLSLLPNAISIPLKPTASRYIVWSLYVVPLYVALLRADGVRSPAAKHRE
ncbi:hypothetical protein CUU80_08575 [Bifidobacterium scaligerum]|uniref:Beta-carotene 15,15'-monooxygenase n=2 Tax=Bifidobacterium scaligerum TaxID=2052656 RepID=A0A2M9HP79_9BIFI|nr:hypothetical protein CUU80_08575 [Bifidobacterium scaligerum]